jgi:hypothetical protein
MPQTSHAMINTTGLDAVALPTISFIQKAEKLVVNYEKCAIEYIKVLETFCDKVKKFSAGGMTDISKLAKEMVHIASAKIKLDEKYDEVLEYFTDNIPADPEELRVKVWSSRMTNAKSSAVRKNHAARKTLQELGYPDVYLALVVKKK